jgi:hypothetical protein
MRLMFLRIWVLNIKRYLGDTDLFKILLINKFFLNEQ